MIKMIDNSYLQLHRQNMKPVFQIINSYIPKFEIQRHFFLDTIDNKKYNDDKCINDKHLFVKNTNSNLSDIEKKSLKWLLIKRRLSI